MPVFRAYPVRNLALAAVALVPAHVFVNCIPHTFDALSLTQISVGMLALSSLLIMVVVHHKRDERNLSRRQVETLLTGALGLFWFSFLTGLRAYHGRSINPGLAGEVDLSAVTHTPRAERSMEPGFIAGRRPYPCSVDDVYCVVEDWTFF